MAHLIPILSLECIIEVTKRVDKGGIELRLPGNRIVKTAVAVFLTALICQFLGWPPVFAVITAIVTLEPTVADSIKKGIVRFPASAIGSFYAVLFIALFGNSPITYTLAASLTIITCFRLKLHAGLLVATITAVAMVEVVYDNYLMSFFIRLGTTTIGIIVSTLVNMFILPPNYIQEIEQNMKQIHRTLGDILGTMDKQMLDQQKMKQLEKQMVKTEELIRFQKEEAHFHPLLDSKKDDFEFIFKQIDHLQLIHYHLNNIQPLDIKKTAFSIEQKQLITSALHDLASYLKGNIQVDLTKHEVELKSLMGLFWRSSHDRETINHSLLPDELIALYELISIFYLVKELNIEKAG